MNKQKLLVAAYVVAAVALAACEQTANTATPNIALNAQTRQTHELGRQIYNFRCYYCHGYSGDARTLAATFLQPAPRNFSTTLPQDLPHARMIDAITQGRSGTAMKGFAETLTSREIAAVANFITEEFVHNKAHNTRYHTDANGWRDHDRFRIAFPFATGEIALDKPIDSLSATQQQGRQLFMSSCVSCHDRARVLNDGPAWSIRPVTFPPDFYLLAESGRTEEISGFDPHHAHEKPPTFRNLTRVEKRGERLYQKNCAFCHAADGTGRNWIGSFLEPNATDLTSGPIASKDEAQLNATIADGIEGSSMPAWKHVLTRVEINAVTAYVSRAFLKSGISQMQRPESHAAGLQSHNATAH